MYGQLDIEEEQPAYSQQIGLKKLLYKYEHQNHQLKTQIHALSQRLMEITSKQQQQKQQKQSTKDNFKTMHEQILQKQIASLFIEIQNTKNQIRANKEKVNQGKQMRIAKTKNDIVLVHNQISKLKHQLTRYQSDLQTTGKINLQQNYTLINPNYQIKLQNLQKQLDEIRKNIRQLQRVRDAKQKDQLKKHLIYVDLGVKNRQLHTTISPKLSQQKQKQKQINKKKSIWSMEYSQENFLKIQQGIEALKIEKQSILSGIRGQNAILKKKLDDLKKQYQQSSKSVQIPEINRSTKLSRKINSPKKQDQNISLIQKPSYLGSLSFQKQNDKNYVPKQPRKVQWSSGSSTRGIVWNDSELRSPISGANLWFDGSLLGLQFLHSLGQSAQHLQLPFKKITPIQYRLNGNDYLQNIIIYLNQNKIIGFDFISKNGRNDSFGMTKNKSKIFNYNIKGPQKPLYSYGIFSINNKNQSSVIKLGFQVL